MFHLRFKRSISYEIGSISKYYHGSKHLRHGLCRRWDESGQLTSEENYADGLNHGTRKVFDDDGKLKMVSNFKNGRLMQRVVYLPDGEKSPKGGVIDGNGESPTNLYSDGYIVSGFKDGSGEWSRPGIKWTTPMKPKSVF